MPSSMENIYIKKFLGRSGENEYVLKTEWEPPWRINLEGRIFNFGHIKVTTNYSLFLLPICILEGQIPEFRGKYLYFL